MAKPKVTIKYDREDREEPTVTVDPEDSVEVVLIDEGANDRRILEYNDVSVYYCDKDCTLSESWVATTPYTWHESEEAFDWRDLDGFYGYPDLEEKYGGLFPDSEAAQVLAYNIDLGHITQEGYKQLTFKK